MFFQVYFNLENCYFPGLTDYSNSPCPPGFWCSGSGPPILCPAGTKRALPGAAAPSQCEPCAGGTFCPDPRATGKPNVEGIPCRASYQCPMGKCINTVYNVNIVCYILCVMTFIVINTFLPKGNDNVLQ